ncbi:hypothetical protein QTN25_006525 [Entamoeba marina]
MNPKQLDSYSMLITSKYFIKKQDFINVICVNSKFKETTEKLRYNPISVATLKLFPKIQTQYLYSKDDKKLQGMNRYEIWYEIDNTEYTEYQSNNIKCHHVYCTKNNAYKYSNKLPFPSFVNFLRNHYFESSSLKSITIPNHITNIGSHCFNNCINLNNIELSTTLTKLKDMTFSQCKSLKTINIPPSIQIFESKCFYNCIQLITVDIPSYLVKLGSNCFSCCTSLKSIKLPSSIIELEKQTFNHCYSLTLIELPSLLTSIGYKCFEKCISLQSINLPSCVISIATHAFSDCHLLNSIEIPASVKILGSGCFRRCNMLKNVSDIPEHCF